jgi:hypothetical protein
MSHEHKLKVGQSAVFSTRPVGLHTTLFLRGGEGGESQATYHIELCCQHDHTIKLEDREPKKVDISRAAGALVTVRNSGFREMTAWTDY